MIGKMTYGCSGVNKNANTNDQQKRKGFETTTYLPWEYNPWWWLSDMFMRIWKLVYCTSVKKDVEVSER